MDITINDQKYALHFGVGFVREIDKLMAIDMPMGQQSIKFGMGLVRMLTALRTNDAGVLSTIIYAATCADSPRPSQATIDEYLDSLNLTDLGKLYDQVVSGVQKSNAVKLTSKNMKA